MIADEILEAFRLLPSIGFVDEPSPITECSDLAKELGLGWLGVKRDDLLPGLLGGSKVRTLDYLLATEPYADADTWVSVGAVGSGHLTALTAAAEKLNRTLVAHIFWEPAIGTAIDNLAYVASGPTVLYG